MYGKDRPSIHGYVLHPQCRFDILEKDFRLRTGSRGWRGPNCGFRLAFTLSGVHVSSRACIFAISESWIAGSGFCPGTEVGSSKVWTVDGDHALRI